MARRSYYIAILIALISTGLLIHLLVTYGFGQRFFIILIILIGGIFSWSDGFEVGGKDERELARDIAWRGLIGTFVIIPLYVIVPIANGGIQSFTRDLLGLILVGIICWTSGLRYGKLQHRAGNICLRHLPFSFALGCTLFYTFRAHGFSHVLIVDGLIVGILNLSLVLMSRQQSKHLSLEHDMEHTPIYSQHNWTEEFQQVLMVEVPEVNYRLLLWHHKDLLRQRYRKLTEAAIQLGWKPEQLVKFVEDQLGVVQLSQDPVKVADSILSSEAFHNVLMNRDEPMEKKRYGERRMETEIADQKMLRRLYDGTKLTEIIWLLRELFDSSWQQKELVRDLYRRLFEKSLSKAQHPNDSLIYSQPNWPEEFQQVLAVEVPYIKGRLPLEEHEHRLYRRYRRLAEKASQEDQNPAQLVADFLEMIPPADDPSEIAYSILNSTAFINLMIRRDDPWEYTSTVDQKMLRQMYDGTDLEQIVRLLREIYLNSLEV